MEREISDGSEGMRSITDGTDDCERKTTGVAMIYRGNQE